MADQIQELLEAPVDFYKDGVQFVKRCTKRTSRLAPLSRHGVVSLTDICVADRNEFIKMSTAVSIGFIVMGVAGYLVVRLPYYFFPL